MRHFPEAGALHAAALEELIATARAIPAGDWNTSVAEGKWTPSQTVSHLTLAYEVLIHELTTGTGLQIRTKWWQRLLLRFSVRPRILAGRGFPQGVRSPREIAPPTEQTVQQECIEMFAEGARRFETLLDEAVQPRNVRLTHPYLGQMKADEALRFCARHVSHHRKQLLGQG